MSGAEHPSARPRSNSKFSFKSDKSGSVKNTKPKIDLKETAEEKRRSHFTLTKKANPNAAINEAQPSMFPCPCLDICCLLHDHSADVFEVAAQLEESTLVSLRSVQHTDSNGNPIGTQQHRRTRFSHSMLISVAHSRARPVEPDETKMGTSSRYNQVV